MIRSLFPSPSLSLSLSLSLRLCLSCPSLSLLLFTLPFPIFLFPRPSLPVGFLQSRKDIGQGCAKRRFPRHPGPLPGKILLAGSWYPSFHRKSVLIVSWQTCTYLFAANMYPSVRSTHVQFVRGKMHNFWDQYQDLKLRIQDQRPRTQKSLNWN